MEMLKDSFLFFPCRKIVGRKEQLWPGKLIVQDRASFTLYISHCHPSLLFVALFSFLLFLLLPPPPQLRY
jgi:hypothetical protein